MSNEQREKILQILYKERSNPLQVFDREDLIQQMGIPWHYIQPEVDYLVDIGYVATKSRKIEIYIYHMLTITPKGVDFVENRMQPSGTLKKIDVFLSSPGDVSEERHRVKRVIERYNGLHSIADRYVLRLLAYEEIAPAEVGKSPQVIVDLHMREASRSDLFICIFGHRMGTPVILEKTGERFLSGTEYEFVDAYRHNQKHGKPYILLYRGLKPFPPETNPEQLTTVEAFFKRFEGEQAEFKGLYKTYRSNEEFEDMLFHDIDAAISKNLIL